MGSRSTSPRGRSRSLGLLLAFTGVMFLAGPTCVAAGLTLDELMRESLARNRDLAAARAQIDAARARLQQTGLRPNPRFEVSDDQTLGNSGEYTRSIGVTQDFSIKSRLARAQDVARVDVARAIVELNEAERGVCGEFAACALSRRAFKSCKRRRG
jgi:cobalt-zinc-cadmium efflux system outer membrane protein